MLKLHVVTPEGPALEHEADEVTLPGLLGEFGVLPGHMPLLAAVKAGVLRYRSGAERVRLLIGPGFARVDGKDSVSVVVQRALAVDKVAREEAEKLLEDAEARLQAASEEEPAAATADRDWAQAQLDALKPS